MKAYSIDLRERVVQAIEKGLGTQGDVAALFGVSRAFVKKMLRLRRGGGCLAPRPHGGGHTPALGADLLRLLRDRLGEHPDATLRDLRQHLADRAGVRVSTATISRTLSKHHVPRKKSRLHAQRTGGHHAPRREGARPPAAPGGTHFVSGGS